MANCKSQGCCERSAQSLDIHGDGQMAALEAIIKGLLERSHHLLGDVGLDLRPATLADQEADVHKGIVWSG